MSINTNVGKGKFLDRTLKLLSKNSMLPYFRHQFYKTRSFLKERYRYQDQKNVKLPNKSMVIEIDHDNSQLTKPLQKKDQKNAFKLRSLSVPHTDLTKIQKNIKTTIHRFQTTKNKDRFKTAPDYNQESNNTYAEAIKKLKSKFTGEDLEEKLSCYTTNKGRSYIRVYREQFHKIFIQRYNKDRITTFFNFEYIEDFDSITKTVNQILQMKQQQLQLIAFIILDQDRDGVIGLTDLFNLVSIQQNNFLLLKDCLKISQCIKIPINNGQEMVFDQATGDFFQDHPLTLTKFRLYKKKSFNIINGSFKNTFIRKKKNTTFTQNQQRQKLQKKRNIFENFQSFVLNSLNELIWSQNAPKKLKGGINFQRFKLLFKQEVPDTLLDFLFAFANIKLPNVVYEEIDFSILQKKQQVVKQEQNKSSYDYFSLKIKQMRSTKQEIKKVIY